MIVNFKAILPPSGDVTFSQMLYLHGSREKQWNLADIFLIHISVVNTEQFNDCHNEISPRFFLTAIVRCDVGNLFVNSTALLLIEFKTSKKLI